MSEIQFHYYFQRYCSNIKSENSYCPSQSPMQKSINIGPQLTSKKPQSNNIFTLSISSKQKPFGRSQQKSQQEQPQKQSPYLMYFPIEEYKNFLKDEKIYLEFYSKDKLFSPGYEPYIKAMGGEVMKRLTPNTTVILTNQMTYEKYQKLKSRIAKVCRSDVAILSFLWIEEIYRQKRKVQKQPYLFDEQVDIVDWRQHQPAQQEVPIPEYFEREVFKQDFINDLQKYFQNPDQDIRVRVIETKKIKKEDLNNPNILWIMPQKFNVFENQEEQQKFKEIAKYNKNQKSQNNQKNDKKKQQKTTQEPHKRSSSSISEKQKPKRPSNRRSQKVEIENKIESKKQQIQSRMLEQKGQNKIESKTQDPTEEKQSDSQFWKRIRQKKQAIQEESINTILEKYLNRPEVNAEKRERRLSEIQELGSAQNCSKQLMWQKKNYHHQNGQQLQIDNKCDNQNLSEDNRSFKNSQIVFKDKPNSKTSKTSGAQQRKKSAIQTQKKSKSSHSSESDPKVFSKTKSLGKSTNPKRQIRLQELMVQFKIDIEEFLQNIGYLKNNDQNDNQNFSKSKQNQRIIYNVIVKQPYIITRVNDFNNVVKQKFNFDNNVFFNVIDFEMWNKHLAKTPVLKSFINFRDLTEEIVGKQNKQNKIEIIRQLFELQSVQEQEAISNYEVMSDLVTSQDYCHLNFYFFCNKKKEQVLMGHLSKIERKNILDYNVLKSVFDLLNRKQLKEKQVSQNGHSSTQSIIPDTNSVAQNNDSLKETIQNQIFPNYRIKSRLTAEIISGKKITCASINLIKNVEFIVKKLKAKFVSFQSYMSNKQNVDIVINDKRTFSKTKSVWEPDYQTFVGSLIVIE